MFADMHCHLILSQFQKDLAEVVERAKKANLQFAVSVGCNLEENFRTLELAKQFSFIKPALGLYPQEAEPLDEEQVDEICDMIRQNKEQIVGIGEVGLDYKHTKDSALIEKQKKAFEKMIKLSEKTKLPLMIHSREAEQDVFDLVKSSNAKNAIFHCFMGKLSIAKKISDSGHFVSVPTNVAFSSEVQGIAEEIDLRSIIVETDSPFLSPFKGKRNEPSFVVEAVKKIAALKKMKLEDAEEIVFETSNKIINAGTRII